MKRYLGSTVYDNTMESAVANEWDAIKALFEAFEAYFQNNDCEVILTQL